MEEKVGCGGYDGAWKGRRGGGGDAVLGSGWCVWGESHRTQWREEDSYIPSVRHSLEVGGRVILYLFVKEKDLSTVRTSPTLCTRYYSRSHSYLFRTQYP